MSWSVILGLFDQAVPIGIVAIIIYMAIISRDMKHIRKDLDNHITDTNKKIDKLEDNMRADLRDINSKIEINTNKLDSKTETNTNKLNSKIVINTDKLNSKIETNTDKLSKLEAGQAEIKQLLQNKP